MKSSTPTLEKAMWLFNSASFRTSPLKTLYRVVRWESYRIRNKSVRFVFDDSLDLILLPNDGVGRLLYYFGSQEPEVFQFMDKYLKEGMTFIDVGANIGTYALYAAKRVGRKGRVFAFEPQRGVFERLSAHIQANRLVNVVAEPYAVGGTDGAVEIIFDTQDNSKSYTRSLGLVQYRTSVCKMVSLNSYLIRQNVARIDYLKIDVEGFELDVLKGASSVLMNLPPAIIQVELVDRSQSRNNSSVASIIESLQSSGYALFALDPVSSRLHALAFGKSVYNTFAVHRQQIEPLRNSGIIM